MLATGKGDEFEPVNINLDSYFIVLAMPPIHVSTADAYSGIKPGAGEHSLADLANRPIAQWHDFLKNDFEDSVFQRYPLIRDLKDTFYNEGAVYASMSGSGASVYGIFEKEIKLPQLEKDNIVFYGI